MPLLSRTRFEMASLRCWDVASVCVLPQKNSTGSCFPWVLPVYDVEWIRADPMAKGVVVMAVAGLVTLGGAQPYSR